MAAHLRESTDRSSIFASTRAAWSVRQDRGASHGVVLPMAGNRPAVPGRSGSSEAGTVLRWLKELRTCSAGYLRCIWRVHVQQRLRRRTM